MNYKKIILGLLSFYFFVSFLAPIENPFDKILRELEVYRSLNPPEKIYVHTDKDFYTNGETIWFKTYLVNGVDHLLSGKSKVIYVELLNEKDSIIAQRKVFSNDIGAHGDILLDNKLKQGNYLLRAYTKYMLNGTQPILFEKEIPVWFQEIKPTEIYGTSSEATKENGSRSEDKVSNDTLKIIKPKLSFYPEGGNLVTGLKSVVGIKAEDENGNGIELQGSIKDSHGNNVALFRTYKFGLGKTEFTPEVGETYTAEINSDVNKKFTLPDALNNGYTLTVKNNKDHILLEVATNLKSGLKGVLLLGHMRGNTFFKHIGQSEDKQLFGAKFLYEDVQDGVVHFTLFTPDGKPICERLTFIDNPENDLELNLKSNKKTYSLRDKVMLDILISDKNENPVEGDFSMSIVSENTKRKKGIQPSHIESWLLLDSDIGATVADPNYFFVKEEIVQRKYLLDALMLTHGWRRFLWTNFINDEFVKKPNYKPEKGIMIAGKTTKFDNKYAAKPSIVTINIVNAGVFQDEQQTDRLGRFSFGPYIINDTIKAIVQAKNGGKDDIFIHIDPSIPYFKFDRLKTKKSIEVDLKILERFLKESKQKKIEDFRYDPLSIELDAIEVKVKSKTRQDIINEEIQEMTTYGTPSDRIFSDSIPGMEAASALDLLRRVAGVQVIGSYPDQRIIVRGTSSFVASADPLFLIDGLPVLPEDFSNLQANEISFIDVLKGSDAAHYASRGTNGVIAAYTYRFSGSSNNQEQYPGVTNFTTTGFYTAREFYKPNYNIENNEKDKPDYRTTLHWEPTIKDKEFEFFTGDKEGSYIVTIEGLTKKGQPLKGVYEFDVIDALD